VEAIYRQISGRVGVSEVIRLSLYPRFEALRAMYVLSKKEFIRILDREGATVIHLKKGETTKIRAARDPGTPKPSYNVPAGKQRSLLLLGDMLKYRQALATLLREAGYEVLDHEAAHAMTLLAENRRVDCVVLDMGIGTADQYQFLGWLAENTRAPVVVLSDDASKEAALGAVKRGARAYVVKPFTRDSILRTLSGVFQPTSSTLPTAQPPAPASGTAR
jgi:CheY-like chemotaxis protein